MPGFLEGLDLGKLDSWPDANALNRSATKSLVERTTGVEVIMEPKDCLISKSNNNVWNAAVVTYQRFKTARMPPTWCGSFDRPTCKDVQRLVPLLTASLCPGLFDLFDRCTSGE